MPSELQRQHTSFEEKSPGGDADSADFEDASLFTETAPGGFPTDDLFVVCIELSGPSSGEVAGIEGEVVALVEELPEQ